MLCGSCWSQCPSISYPTSGKFLSHRIRKPFHWPGRPSFFHSGTSKMYLSLLGRSCWKRNWKTSIVICFSSHLLLLWVVSFLVLQYKFPSKAQSETWTPQTPTPPPSPAATKTGTMHRRGNSQQLPGTSTPLVTADNIPSLEPYIISHHRWEGRGRQKKHQRQQLLPL